MMIRESGIWDTTISPVLQAYITLLKTFYVISHSFSKFHAIFKQLLQILLA